MNAIRTLLARFRREWRERWQWYQAQRQVPRERHWWDAYNL
jgi:hypothetical protein